MFPEKPPTSIHVQGKHRVCHGLFRTVLYSLGFGAEWFARSWLLLPLPLRLQPRGPLGRRRFKYELLSTSFSHGHGIFHKWRISFRWVGTRNHQSAHVFPLNFKPVGSNRYYLVRKVGVVIPNTIPSDFSTTNQMRRHAFFGHRRFTWNGPWYCHSYRPISWIRYHDSRFDVNGIHVLTLKSTLFSFWVLWPLPVGPAQFHPWEPRTQQRTKAGGHMLLQVFFHSAKSLFLAKDVVHATCRTRNRGLGPNCPKVLFFISCFLLSCVLLLGYVSQKSAVLLGHKVFQLQRTRVAMDRLQLLKQSLDLLCFFSSDHGSSNIYHLVI